MPEAKSILRNFASPTDIVIARSNVPQSQLADSIFDQPLSLLALYDEEDLINLSATPLRPNANEHLTNGSSSGGSPKKCSPVQPTVIRIGEDSMPTSQNYPEFRSIVQLQENPPRRLLPKMPSTLSRTANLLSHSEHHRGDPMSLINPEPFCTLPRNRNSGNKGQ